jgi:hypothetical protein
MDASSQTRKGASSQESVDDKNDICLRGIFKIPPLAPRPVAGIHTFALPFYQYQFHPPAETRVSSGRQYPDSPLNRAPHRHSRESTAARIPTSARPSQQKYRAELAEFIPIPIPLLVLGPAPNRLPIPPPTPLPTPAHPARSLP